MSAFRISHLEEFKLTVTASVPGESNQGAKPRTGKAFPRSARLLRHADFERVYKLGRRHFSASMTVFYLDRGALGPAKIPVVPGLRIGFTVGRALGGAVDRNRMKRRLREAVRLNWPEVQANADVVINPKKVLLKTRFDAVLNEVLQAFVILEKKLAGKGKAETADKRGPGVRKPGA